MEYPIQSSAQLSAHLRSLRKSRGLNQVRLGAALGVGQARIARIERDPTAVSVEQFMAVLGALGVQMVLRTNGAGAAGVAPTDAPSTPLTRSARSKRHTPVGEPW
jgi:HTH-type transcriptional regulator/antitoxin HipB